MKVITQDILKGKKVLLRFDIDVSITEGKVTDDFRLLAGLETVEMCLKYAQKTTIIGHIGRPDGQDEKYSTLPIVDWLEENLEAQFTEGALMVLENLRFDKRESIEDPKDKDALEFAELLKGDHDLFINEAFASHHPAVSTTTLPTLMPSYFGLRFTQEIEELSHTIEHPHHPVVVIIGGAKVEDKYPAVLSLADRFDDILVGGLLAKKVKSEKLKVKSNVSLATMSENGLDISDESIESFKRKIAGANQLIWAGPVGKFEDDRGNRGNQELAKAILEAGVEVLIGGGDTIAMLNALGLIDQMQDKGFVSVGGGAMLEFLMEGTLPTIEAISKID